MVSGVAFSASSLSILSISALITVSLSSNSSFIAMWSINILTLVSCSIWKVEVEVELTIYLKLHFLAELLLTVLLFEWKNLMISSKTSDIPVFLLLNTVAT